MSVPTPRTAKKVPGGPSPTRAASSLPPPADLSTPTNPARKPTMTRPASSGRRSRAETSGVGSGIEGDQPHVRVPLEETSGATDFVRNRGALLAREGQVLDHHDVVLDVPHAAAEAVHEHDALDRSGRTGDTAAET